MSVGEEELGALNLEAASPCDTISSGASTVVFPESAENDENDCQNGEGVGAKKRKHAESKEDNPKKKYKPNSPLGDLQTATALESATTISPANTIDTVGSSSCSAKNVRPEKGQRYELGTKVAKMFRDDSRRAREKKKQLGNLVNYEGDGEGVMVKKDFSSRIPKLGMVIEYDSNRETYKIRYECNLEECEHEEDLAKLVIPNMAPSTSNKQITSSKEEKVPLELQGMKKYDCDPRGKKPANIDRDVLDDPIWHAGYCEEMYTSHRIREASLAARPRYIKNQPDLNEKMRAILVDWLIEVHLKFKLVPEALHLTVNLVDRYLDIDEVVSRRKLQLVGMAAIFIAAKFEDQWPPELRDLVYICDRAYSKDEILDMETKMLTKLDYRINAPTPYTFLSRYLKAAHCDKRMICLANLVVDGALLSYDLLHYTPSQIAASAVLIARKSLARDEVVWSPTLIKYTVRSFISDRQLSSSTFDLIPLVSTTAKPTSCRWRKPSCSPSRRFRPRSPVWTTSTAARSTATFPTRTSTPTCSRGRMLLPARRPVSMHRRLKGSSRPSSTPGRRSPGARRRRLRRTRSCRTQRRPTRPVPRDRRPRTRSRRARRPLPGRGPGRRRGGRAMPPLASRNRPGCKEVE